MANKSTPEIIATKAGSKAAESSLEGVIDLNSTQAESLEEYNLFPDWLSKHLPDFGISVAAKKFIYRTYQVSTGTAFTTLVGLLIAGTIVGTFWYVAAAILGALVLYAIVKHFIIPAIKYIKRANQSASLLQNIAKELEGKGVNTHELELTLLSSGSKRDEIIAQCGKEVSIEEQQACKELGLDSTSPPQNFINLPLSDDETAALISHFNLDPNSDLHSEPDGILTPQHLANRDLEALTDKKTPLTTAIQKVNQMAISARCGKECFQSLSPQDTATNVFNSMLSDYIQKTKPESKYSIAHKLKMQLAADNTDGLRFHNITNILNIPNNEDAAKGLFYILNQASATSRLRRSGKLSSGKMLHDGVSNPCLNRINQVALDLSLATCVAIVNSSIITKLQEEQQILLSKPPLTVPSKQIAPPKPDIALDPDLTPDLDLEVKENKPGFRRTNSSHI
ncbi:MAG: hypothetical protein VXW87_00915 [Pseudomonadota bacterium]|nr:hypothetical protein [Pseudomonadota bacterium]